jgi:hypothetical protein
VLAMTSSAMAMQLQNRNSSHQLHQNDPTWSRYALILSTLDSTNSFLGTAMSCRELYTPDLPR